MKSLSKPMPKKDKYPCLMEETETGLIVLFYDVGHGTVVNCPSFGSLGYYSKEWDMSRFQSYKGQIVLTED